MDSSTRFPDPQSLLARLSGRASHDLNNLIAVLAGHLYLLRNDPHPGGVATSSLDAMHSAIGQLERLSGNLARVAALGADPPARIPINDVVRRAAGGRPAPGPRLDLAEGLPEIRARASDLERALAGLLDNAAQAAAGEAGARVSTSRDPEDGAVVVSVEDPGPGIPDRVAGRLFEPFTSTRGAGPGSGLGLFIAAAVADAHGGSCRVEARPEGGTRVSLRLPAPD